MKTKKAKWVVHVQGDRKADAEISILREDNEGGKESYGWDDPDNKIIILSGNACGSEDSDDSPMTKKVWDKYIVGAQALADSFNTSEGI